MNPEVPSIAFLILKVLVLLGLIIYGVFAAVLVRQEQLMAHVLEESFEPMIRLLVIGHLVVAVGIFILALLFL